MINIKIIFGIMLSFSFLCMPACDSDDTDSKTTYIDKVELRLSKWAQHIGWWESNLKDPNLQLSNVMPYGIDDNENYDVTISGTTNKPLSKFQIVFSTSKGDLYSWQDLCAPTGYLQIQDDFYLTVTLRTNRDAERLFNVGALALTHEIKPDSVDPPYTSDEDDGNDGDIMAILSNVVVTITER